MKLNRSKRDHDIELPIPTTDDSDLVNLRCSALFLRKDMVLLCRRTDSESTWVLPGGTPRRGEGTAAAAQREVAEETGLDVAVDRVAFVLETTSRDVNHHLIEIVFVGKERNPSAEPRQIESGLLPSFVSLDGLDQLGLRPPIAGYIRGYAMFQQPTDSRPLFTAAYLGNLWRATEGDAHPPIPRIGLNP